MTELEPSALALFWAAVIAIAIVVYVVLHGFDLGVGILFGLIFRGVAFEYRHSGRARGLWDRGFTVGSGVVAFLQGTAVGAMIRGIDVVDGQYAGVRSNGWRRCRCCAASV